MSEEPVKVPLLDLRPQYASIREEVDAAIRGVLDSQQFVLGPEVEALEAEVAAYSGAGHGVGCASGSDALLLPLMALGVGPGDQVVVPTYTFFATAGSVARLGAEPVFADLDPASYNVTPQTLARAAERCTRLKLLLPVHLYGQAVDLDAIGELARSLGVPVLEDAAQAIGTEDRRGRRVGSAGNPACFSFFPTKNLGAFGEGGMVTTDDADFARELRMLRIHGMEPKYYHARVGLNARLHALQAAVLRVKLRHLEAWHAGRRRNADHYDERFRAAGAEVSGVAWGEASLDLRIPQRSEGAGRHIFNQYVIRVPESRRDDLRAHLTEQRIGTEIYYPVPLHLQECFRDLGWKPGDLPASERAARETIALPIYPDLEKRQLDHVIDTTVSFLSG